MTTAPEPNWTDQTIWTGDNLDIMRGMNSAMFYLIYLTRPSTERSDNEESIDNYYGNATYKLQYRQ